MENKTTTAYISLGGNMGGEAERFDAALDRMNSWPGIRVVARSGLYRTEPQGDPDQPWFTNQVSALHCTSGITPEKLLRNMLQLETEFGRIRDESRRFGPRTLDLDLLLFGDQIYTGDGLQVPHPRMAQRAFVLVPLCEIAPDLRLPGGDLATAALGRLQYTIFGKDIYQK